MNRLIWLRAGAQLILLAERLAAALWAPLAVLAAAAGLALLAPGAPLLFLLPFATLAAILPLLRGSWRAFRMPDATQAERWLERRSRLPHEPLAVLRDTPAGASGPLWKLHQARAASTIGALRLGWPRAELAAADPRALRFAALLLLASGIAVAGREAPARLAAAFLPGFGLSLGTQAPTLQAWIEPPAYTGQPPIFLAPGGDTITVPAGAKLTVSLGGAGRPTLRAGGHAARFRRVAEGTWQATATLTRSGRIVVSRWFGTLAAWGLHVLPNDPPRIAWSGTPGRAGSTLETRLPWHVAQRWGVAALTAELVPEGHADLPPLAVPVPLPGTPKDAGGAALADLAANPYAGLPMRGVLRGRDVSGQQGASGPVTFRLPAREFHDPLARAVIDLRRRLALNPAAPHDAADDLAALAEAPVTRTHHSGAFLNLAAAAALLRERGVAAEPEAQARLYTLALDLDGALPGPAEQKLQAARDALRRALTERAQGRISDADLAKKMEQLRQALAQRLAEMARRAFEKGQLGQFDPHGKSFNSPRLDRMIQHMQQQAQSGHMQEARREMAELENLLDRLNNAKVLSPEQAARAAEANRQARQLMRATQDLARREAGLMDRGQARAPRPPPMPTRPQIWGQDMPTPPPDPEKLEADEAARGTDARTERALQRALQALKQAAGQFGAKTPQSFEDAAKSMQRAEQALTEGDDSGARQQEAQAVQDLQKGGQDMARQMQQGSQLAIVPGGQDEGGEGFGPELGGEPSGPRDPLGRPVHGAGGRAEDDGSVRVPTEMEQGRSRAIQQELRRRDADRGRPQEELEYIERLLRPF